MVSWSPESSISNCLLLPNVAPTPCGPLLLADHERSEVMEATSNETTQPKEGGIEGEAKLLSHQLQYSTPMITQQYSNNIQSKSSNDDG